MTTVTADNKGRITLGSKFAGKVFRVEEIDEFAVRAEIVTTIPAREMWLWQNKEALESVQRGLQEWARGEFADNSAWEAAKELKKRLDEKHGRK